MLPLLLLGLFGFMAHPIMVSQVTRAAGAASTLAMSLATSSFQVGVAGAGRRPSLLQGLGRS